MVSHVAMGMPLTANRGDRIAQEPQTIEEKAKQIAVDKYDMTGAHLQVPAYFIFKYPDGKTEALHHVRDAKKISDIIRQMHLEEEISTVNISGDRNSNFNGLFWIAALSSLALLLITATMVIGVF
jgi:hypothetical protein